MILVIVGYCALLVFCILCAAKQNCGIVSKVVRIALMLGSAAGLAWIVAYIEGFSMAKFLDTIGPKYLVMDLAIVLGLGLAAFIILGIMGVLGSKINAIIGGTILVIVGVWLFTQGFSLAIH